MKKMGCAGCLLILSVLWCTTGNTFTGYSFHTMWPKGEKSWYFPSPYRVHVDKAGTVYVLDRHKCHVQKFSPDGELITQWGTEGTQKGQFESPHGLAGDSSGFIYVSDYETNRMQKFDANGTFLFQWGASGTEPGQFFGISGIAVGPQDMVYVADTFNHRIQKFDASGNFILEWGTKGYGPGQFNSPEDVAVGSSGDVYVADTDNHRIQRFTADGEFLGHWGGLGVHKGQFWSPSGVSIHPTGKVAVTDTVNSRIQIFSPDGVFLSKIGSYGAGTGEFYLPRDVAFSSNGAMYVADYQNFQIQKFTPGGDFSAKWGYAGAGAGEFKVPQGIAVGPGGNVYVTDMMNHRIQVFSPAGEYLFEWGSQGDGPGQFLRPRDILAHPDGNIYVADTANKRIQKFTSDGFFITQWGKEGAAEGEFGFISDIAADASGDIWVLDKENHNVQKFTPDGKFLLSWGEKGMNDGQLWDPDTILIDPLGIVYVGDREHCLQKFEPDGTFIANWGKGIGPLPGISCMPSDFVFDLAGNLFILDRKQSTITHLTPDGTELANFGESGYSPGLMDAPSGLALNSAGEIYVSDTGNNRVQVFNQYDMGYKSKAIIVAGGGADDNLWDATEVCANQAFRYLQFQGYTKDSIHYLTSDLDIDLDGNGLFDDADTLANGKNFKAAILSWASDAEELILYFTDHGGDQTFKIGKNEMLPAADLNGWLDAFQENTGAKVIIVYDACKAGSFLNVLSSDQYDRVFIASASADQSAHFTSTGQLSFSGYFWTRIMNGEDLYDAYLNSSDAIETVFSSQTPLVDVNGNGLANEIEDLELIKGVTIGKGLIFASDVPVIGSVSDTIVLNGKKKAVITAENVIDADGISRVWAIVIPPDSGQADPDTPVLKLPEIELFKLGNKSYEGVYNGFKEQGIYKVSVLAADAYGHLSLPKTTYVIQTAGPQHTTLTAGLDLTIPCLNYQDNCFQIMFHNVFKKGLGLHWKLDKENLVLKQGCSKGCAEMNDDFFISIPEIKFGNDFYKADLVKIIDPQDPFGHYWKLTDHSVKEF